MRFFKIAQKVANNLGYFCKKFVTKNLKNLVTLVATTTDDPPKVFFTPLNKAKPQVSLTAPNRDHFARVALTVLDFLDAIAKAKN